MEIYKQDLIKIVERASTITERLGSGFFTDEAQTNEHRINYLLERWCQIVAQGNEEKFTKRLTWDGLDINIIRRGLGTVRLAAHQPLPTWVKTLKLVMQAAAVSLELFEIGDSGAHRYLNHEEPIAFQEFCLPFIKVAQQKLIVQAGSSYSLLTEVAHASLERHLLRRLSYICSKTLKIEFSIFGAFKQSTFTHLLAPPSSSPDIKRYQAFIKQMLQGGLLAFFQEYSVLARLMATATDLWVEANQEFLRRLESDWLTIQQTFQGNANVKNLHTTSQEQVVAIEPALSDLHNRGRSVAVLTFASGQKLIYKPKDLGMEVAYFQFLHWLNKQGAKVLLPLKVLKVLNRSTYGWVEYVQHLPCKDKAAAQRYYQRAGMLLCLTYVFGGIDFHNENLIANGEHPVLVDLETLMHPQVRDSRDVSDHALKSEEGEAAQILVNQQFYNSVLRSGLLPRWQLESDGQGAYDASGLGDGDEKEVAVPLLKWQNINTDNMGLGCEFVKTVSQTNAPFLAGINLLLSDYLEDFIEGFQQLYQFLMNHRDVILADNGPLAAFAHQPVRFLFRLTRVYASVLNQALDPKLLRDGCERSIELDILSRGLLSSDSKHPFWPLLSVEQQAIEQLDIPLFTARSDSDALTIPLEGDCATAPHQTIERCFKQPTHSHVISRFQQLSKTDLAQQISFIRGALYARNAGQMHRTSTAESIDLNIAAAASFTPRAMVQQALAIAQELKQVAVHSTDGSASWIGLSYLPDGQRLRLQSLGYGLYDGICGVALFLAALEKVTGGAAGLLNLALAALQPLHQYVQESECKQEFAKSIGIGGGTGLGSIIYALVRISQFLHVEKLLRYEHGIATPLQDAKQLASLVTTDLIVADQKFDIISGSAGAILGLIALHKATADKTENHFSALEQAIACGHHLLNHRIASDGGYRAWANKEGKLLTGFSHGAAGIAYALLRLYEITKVPVFLDAAEEAIAYERSVFSPQVGNWPDFSLEEPEFMTNWCHGAPGIGLGRLGSLVVLDTNEIRQEIEIALETTQRLGLQGIDHLCCGNLGRLEFLLVAAQKLSRPELLEAAQKQANLVVAHAKQKGAFRLIPGLSGSVYSPGFFQGIAGIGYELLRLAYPDQLPSVLLWE
jgi:type 2 lantibiotic biosynthesis protein LanM